MSETDSASGFPNVNGRNSSKSSGIISSSNSSSNSKNRHQTSPFSRDSSAAVGPRTTAAGPRVAAASGGGSFSPSQALLPSRRPVFKQIDQPDIFNEDPTNRNTAQRKGEQKRRKKRTKLKMKMRSKGGGERGIGPGGYDGKNSFPNHANRLYFQGYSSSSNSNNKNPYFMGT